MMIGDLAFFPSHGSLFDKLIELRTGDGDADTDDTLTHVEIVVAVSPDGTRAETIGALAQGIVRHALPAGAILVATGARCLPERLPAMLTWLGAQVGERYGWDDIASQALTWLDRNGPYVAARHAMDCSHLAALALTIAGYPLPPDLIVNAALVTPASLYRAVTATVGTAQR